MPLLWQRSPASATEGSDVVFNFTATLCEATYLLLYWTWTGSADYTTDVDVTVPAGQLLELYRYQQLRIRLMSN
jgi:hypothetical protein